MVHIIFFHILNYIHLRSIMLKRGVKGISELKLDLSLFFKMFEPRKWSHFFQKGHKDFSHLRNVVVFQSWNSTAECIRSLYLVC